MWEVQQPWHLFQGALDPDGAWYDETIEKPIMQEGCPSVDGSGQRGKKLKSKVSVSLSYPFSRVY
jgi:hypothetical protein